MRLRTFVAATALGIIPATFAFAFCRRRPRQRDCGAGNAYRACLAAGRPDCRLDFDLTRRLTPQLLAALVALGVLALIPVVVKRLRARRRA